MNWLFPQAWSLPTCAAPVPEGCSVRLKSDMVKKRNLVLQTQLDRRAVESTDRLAQLLEQRPLTV